MFVKVLALSFIISAITLMNNWTGPKVEAGDDPDDPSFVKKYEANYYQHLRSLRPPSGAKPLPSANQNSTATQFFPQIGKRSAPQGNFLSHSKTQLTLANQSTDIPNISAPRQSQGQFSESGAAMLEVRKKQKTSQPRKTDEGEKSNQHEHAGQKKIPLMRHRLRRHLSFWKSFARSTLVLSWITNGFPLLWNELGEPVAKFNRNHQSAFDYKDFVAQTIAEYLEAGSVLKWDRQPHIVSPLGVVAQKKLRLIFDARYINKHLIIPPLRYEDLGFAHQFLRPNDFMVTFDLKKGYHHVDIHDEYLTFLGFEWDGQFYVFSSLPFGLASACWAFSKITRELLSKWRRQGYRCSGYLDDSIHAHQSPDILSERVSSTIVPDMRQCGLVINEEKSDMVPLQIRDYLGFFIDTVRRVIGVPSKKREKLIALIQNALDQSRNVLVHDLEIITGTLASMHWAFGSLSRMMTMNIYADIPRAEPGGKRNRFATVSLSDAAIEDLKFWLTGFDCYNGSHPIWQPREFHLTIHTDAAGVNTNNEGGWAGWTVDNDKNIIVARGIWTEEHHIEWEKIGVDHSTFQELFAIKNVIFSFNKDGQLRDKRIQIKTDNQGVYFIINRAGSRYFFIHELCKEILWYCIAENITLHATWIPRESNKLADFYSKISDSGDWKLRPCEFQKLKDRFGPFDVDLFASNENKQVEKFYSLYYQPNTSGVDAYNFTWGRSCWCNPPFGQMAKVLAHAQFCKARMCLITPFTPTAIWWPTLVAEDDPGFFAPFVRECVELGDATDLFLCGKHSYKFKGRKPRWQTLALLVDFGPRMLMHASHVHIPEHQAST